MNRAFGFRLAAIVLGLFGGLVLLEVGLRIYKVATHRDPAEALRRTVLAVPPPFTGSCAYPAPQSGLRHLIEPSARPELVYSLKRNIDTCYVGKRFRTNSAGIRRDAPIKTPKDAGTFRILVLGDSMTLGQGVEDDETFSYFLEQMLRRGHGKNVEVVNAGLDGYDTIQEGAWLEERGTALEPDCIIALYCGNDTDPPGFLRKPATGREIDRSYVVRALKSVLHPPTDPWADRLDMVNENDVAPEYRHWAGVEGHVLGLRMIAEYAERARIPFVFFAQYEKFRDFSPAIELMQRTHVIKPDFQVPIGLEYQVSLENGHFNRLAHEVVAQRMLAGLLACGPRCTGVEGVPIPEPVGERGSAKPGRDVYSVAPPVRLPLALDGFAEGPVGSFLVEGSAGTFALVVSARGDACRDSTGGLYPELVVSVDGKSVGSVPLTSSDFVEYRTGPFALSGALQKIQISMAADYYQGPECDRNVHLDWLEVVSADPGSASGASRRAAGGSGAR